MTRVLIVDNYDSFTYNLFQYLGELGAELEVVRNDRATADELLERAPDRVVVSPGPGTPDDAGISLEAMRRFPEAGVRTLGVCLGHQALGQAFGGKVVRHEPIHGKSAEVEHDGRTIFAGLDSPLTVGRYHSLVVEPDLPDCLEPAAHGGGVLMALRHRELPAEGVQFHPESVLTPHGKALLANFLADPAPLDPVALAHAFVDAVNTGDIESQLALVHEDFVQIESDSLPGAVRTRGHEELRRYAAGFQRNWSHWHVEPLEVEASGERVWIRARMDLRAAQSGAEVSREWHYVVTARAERLSRFEGFDDATEARRAAGLE